MMKRCSYLVVASVLGLLAGACAADSQGVLPLADRGLAAEATPSPVDAESAASDTPHPADGPSEADRILRRVEAMLKLPHPPPESLAQADKSNYRDLPSYVSPSPPAGSTGDPAEAQEFSLYYYLLTEYTDATGNYAQLQASCHPQSQTCQQFIADGKPRWEDKSAKLVHPPPRRIYIQPTQEVANDEPGTYITAFYVESQMDGVADWVAIVWVRFVDGQWQGQDFIIRNLPV
ncbi:hypothetical protein [Buchananella hordeovulneris]|nr:hypothetical protein [Buchananella hordeovulneris]MDO5080020.1 hypothetical protein [Buchananella hordeovulneris]RRD43451.1 hypothetical protein EII13_07000 [Buchananella hordeovulneris]RRD52731.1 hypothetical protein EII12_03910 [Buchananella hordeovulneris]